MFDGAFVVAHGKGFSQVQLPGSLLDQIKWEDGVARQNLIHFLPQAMGMAERIQY